MVWSGASSRGERGAAEAQVAEARPEEEERTGETDVDRWAPLVSDGRRGCGVTHVSRKRREERAGALRGWSGPGERERGSRPGWAACWGGKGSWAREKGLGWVSWAGLWV